MESAEDEIKKKPRYILELGKVQVIKIEKGAGGNRLTVSFGKGVTATFGCPPRAEIRLGDYLTIYTEVLVDAEPAPTSVQ